MLSPGAIPALQRLITYGLQLSRGSSRVRASLKKRQGGQTTRMRPYSTSAGCLNSLNSSLSSQAYRGVVSPSSRTTAATRGLLTHRFYGSFGRSAISPAVSRRQFSTTDTKITTLSDLSKATKIEPASGQNVQAVVGSAASNATALSSPITPPRKKWKLKLFLLSLGVASVGSAMISVNFVNSLTYFVQNFYLVQSAFEVMIYSTLVFPWLKHEWFLTDPTTIVDKTYYIRKILIYYHNKMINRYFHAQLRLFQIDPQFVPRMYQEFETIFPSYVELLSLHFFRTKQTQFQYYLIDKLQQLYTLTTSKIKDAFIDDDLRGVLDKYVSFGSTLESFDPYKETREEFEDTVESKRRIFHKHRHYYTKAPLTYKRQVNYNVLNHLLHRVDTLDEEGDDPIAREITTNKLLTESYFLLLARMYYFMLYIDVLERSHGCSVFDDPHSRFEDVTKDDIHNPDYNGKRLLLQFLRDHSRFILFDADSTTPKQLSEHAPPALIPLKIPMDELNRMVQELGALDPHRSQQQTQSQTIQQAIQYMKEVIQQFNIQHQSTVVSQLTAYTHSSLPDMMVVDNDEDMAVPTQPYVDPFEEKHIPITIAQDGDILHDNFTLSQPDEDQRDKSPFAQLIDIIERKGGSNPMVSAIKARISRDVEEDAPGRIIQPDGAVANVRSQAQRGVATTSSIPPHKSDTIETIETIEGTTITIEDTNASLEPTDLEVHQEISSLDAPPKKDQKKKKRKKEKKEKKNKEDNKKNKKDNKKKKKKKKKTTEQDHHLHSTPVHDIVDSHGISLHQIDGTTIQDDDLLDESLTSSQPPRAVLIPPYLKLSSDYLGYIQRNLPFPLLSRMISTYVIPSITPKSMRDHFAAQSNTQQSEAQTRQEQYSNRPSWLEYFYDFWNQGINHEEMEHEAAQLAQALKEDRKKTTENPFYVRPEDLTIPDDFMDIDDNTHEISEDLPTPPPLQPPESEENPTKPPPRWKSKTVTFLRQKYGNVNVSFTDFFQKTGERRLVPVLIPPQKWGIPLQQVAIPLNERPNYLISALMPPRHEVAAKLRQSKGQYTIHHDNLIHKLATIQFMLDRSILQNLFEVERIYLKSIPQSITDEDLFGLSELDISDAIAKQTEQQQQYRSRQSLAHSQQLEAHTPQKPRVHRTPPRRIITSASIEKKVRLPKM